MVKPKETVTVLYIMGMPRSGSTIIDRILGAHDNIVSVGELINLPVNGWINNEYCSCGSRTNDCTFWSTVKADWSDKSDTNTVHNYLSLQSKLEKLWVRFKSFDLPDNYKDDFNNYATMTLSLYKSIQTVSNKKIIVDSSKNPLRAYLLSLMPGINLRIIHLVRDARGVAWSKMKSFKKDEKAGVQADLEPTPLWRTAINWCRINLRCDWVRKQLQANYSMLVCYEDFTNNPEKYFSRIGGLTDEDFTSLIDCLLNKNIQSVGHTIAGNRLRMSPEIKLRVDNEWSSKLSLFENYLVLIVTGWLFSKYKATC
ncbi:MAG: sulfotransferase [Methylococcales bacterium]